MSPRRRLPLAAAAIAAGLAILAGAAGLHGAALAQGPTVPPEPGPTPTAGTGRALYLRDCAWCHGERGRGTVYGPPVVGAGAASADFLLRTGRMPIREPMVQPPRQRVRYTEREIREMVGFVAALGDGPPVPRVDVEAGDLTRGFELYQAHCEACHGSTGAGAALSSGLVAPPLTESTPVQVAEAIRLGGGGLRSGNMPRFGADTLSDTDVAAVARYVQYLRDPHDRGGHALGHFGPIPEGFVAWSVGLLALVLFVRWLGVRA